MKEISSKYKYKIENLAIRYDQTESSLIEFMTIFYDGNNVVDHFRDYDDATRKYFLRITTKCNCDEFFKKFKEMFPKCKITKTTEVTTTTVEEAEEVLG